MECALSEASPLDLEVDVTAASPSTIIYDAGEDALISNWKQMAMSR